MYTVTLVGKYSTLESELRRGEHERKCGLVGLDTRSSRLIKNGFRHAPGKFAIKKNSMLKVQHSWTRKRCRAQRGDIVPCS